ncbi:hypothetical protein AYI69_g11096 [Smittium culicis]|uniref:CCHC-type domain-containing protein n=1 Tax=Smittium culicis TaxID=133412 RepID=A0A1R1X148_9FUNG|nr:hypothetical protein AYI69_g11096 [Smittium culicis]
MVRIKEKNASRKELGHLSPGIQPKNKFSYADATKNTISEKSAIIIEGRNINPKAEKKFGRSGAVDIMPYQDLTEYRDQSILHWYKGDSHKKNLKKLCFGGSEYTVCCPWDQFGKDRHNGVQFTSDATDDFCSTAIYNKFSRATYFTFEEKHEAKQFLDKKLFYNNREVELYGTVKYSEEITVIKIPQIKLIRPKTAIKAICKQLEMHGEIMDISAKSKNGKDKILPFGIEFLLVKKKESEISNFIEVEGETIGIFWKGCRMACNFCKEYGHWKSDCARIKEKEAYKKPKQKMVIKSPQHDGKSNKTSKKPETEPMKVKIAKKLTKVQNLETSVISKTLINSENPHKINEERPVQLKTNVLSKQISPNKSIDIKGVILASRDASKSSIKSSVESSDVDIEGFEEEGGIQLVSEEVKTIVKKERISDRDSENDSKDSDYNEYCKVYDDKRKMKITEAEFTLFNKVRFGEFDSEKNARWVKPPDKKE